MTGTPQFIDISAFQGAIDFRAYCAWAKQWDGIARVAMKSTEGVGFTDPSLVDHRAGALAAGMDVIIFYHFARPDLGNSATDEANYQRSVVGDIRPNDQIILDLEVQALATEAWAHVWLFQQEQNYGGKLPGIYASSSYVESNLQYSPLNRYPLWLANWQYTPDERPPVPAPWSSYEFVQYTDRATNIPGIAGSVDANIFLGGTPPVQQYGPDSSDFGAYFTATDADHWTCKQTGAIVQFGNLSLYRTLSLDGRSLPVIGLPLEGEQSHTEADGYYWSSQQFERATMVYDPEHRFDNQPGMDSSYLKHVNPPQTQIIEKIPDHIKADILAASAALDTLMLDAGVMTRTLL